MKATKEVRRIALAMAWNDGLEVEDAGQTMESWRWDDYLVQAQAFVDVLTARGDAAPARPLVDLVEELGADQ